MPQNEPFVTRFEYAIMQFEILNQARQAGGEVTKENLRKVFKGSNLQMGDHLDHCIRELVQDNHLEEAGNGRFRISDDGREDVQKVQHLVVELASRVGGGNQQGGQRQGGQQTQQATATAGTQTSSGSTGTAGATGSKPIDPPSGQQNLQRTTGGAGGQVGAGTNQPGQPKGTR